VAGVTSSHRFVGRSVELGSLEAGLDASFDGRASGFLLTGDAGVGKTRLVEELLARAEARGAVGLVGACLDLEEGHLPFGPFVEALRPRLRELDPHTRDELQDLGGKQLGRLLPELSETRDQAPEEALAQGRLFELVLGLLERLAADAPLVLVLEDLHWSDRSTRDLLAFLVRNLRTERVLLIATYRSDELYRGHPLRPFVAELERSRRLGRVDLQPFTREELAEHMTGILGAPVEAALIDSIFERSEGNAFFAEELLAAVRHAPELPPSLSDILLARVDRRSSATQDVLRVVAVGGRRVSDRLLAAVSPLSDTERVSALQEAVVHGLLIFEPSGSYAFRHALMREAVYQDLLPEERSRVHSAYGEALSAAPELARDELTVVGDLAHHWYAAHDLPRALAAATQAGSVAEHRSGFAEARGHYERALELWDQVDAPAARVGIGRIELIRRAAEVANLAGDHGRAAALIRTAIGYVGRVAEPVLAGVLRERLGRFLWAAGDSDAALSAYEDAAALVPSDPPSEARARVLAARGQGLMLLARHEESRACCEEAIAIARRVGARREEGHALNTLGCDLAYLGDPRTAVAHLQEARRIAEHVGDLDDLLRAYLNLSDLLAGPLNRLEEALTVSLEGIERSQKVGMAGDYGVSLQSNAASALLHLGRLDEAATVLVAAERRNPTEMAAIDLQQCRARVDVCRGAFTDAADHLARAQRLMVNTIDPPYQAQLREIEAELALWRGCPGEAADAVGAGLRQLQSVDDSWFAAPLLWLGLRAQADAAADAAGRGDGEASIQARQAGAQLLAGARALLDGPTFIASVTRSYACMCEAEAERLARADDPQPWERAVAVWEATGHPYPETYARWRLAEALLAQRRGRDGGESLARAHETAVKMGATALARELATLAQRARIELTSSKASPPAAPEESSPAVVATGLTARQLEVLALIAAGRTNREIAATLFITEKTAGAHVSSILGRLGVRSRVQAATAAHRLGLVPAAEE
jgi:DNA-binding CsgD family transcriptional regulator/tetratricopeptide (TPR) repeat protein